LKNIFKAFKHIYNNFQFVEKDAEELVNTGVSFWTFTLAGSGAASILRPKP
jgi:hypothetical protein